MINNNNNNHRLFIYFSISAWKNNQFQYMYHGDTLGVFVPVNNLNSSDMSWKKDFEVVGSGESVEVMPVQINGECVLSWFEGGENKFYTLCGKLLTLFSLIINFSSHFIRFYYFVSFHSTYLYLCLYLYLY